MKNIKALGVFLVGGALSSALMGCSASSVTWSKQGGVEDAFALDSDRTIYKDDKAKLQTLARAPFELKFIRTEDKRLPSQMADVVSGKILYEYQPDKLLGGVEAFMGTQMPRYARVGGVKDVAYPVEMEMKRLRTYVQKGDFMSGMYGEYVAAAEAKIIVRNPNSKVLFQDTVSVQMEKKREAQRGEHPSAKKDKQEMKELTRRALRKMAVNIAWEINKRLDHDDYMKDKKSHVRWFNFLPFTD